MQKHTKIYMDFFDYVIDDFIPCEVCGQRAVDVHHIYPRGIGGSKTKDYIENLVGLCRIHHMECEKNKDFNSKVKDIHLANVKRKETGLHF
jgi:hypothetical protein